MKAILLATAAAASLAGCAYYDPYVYNNPYYGAGAGYYGAPYVTPQPYYYGYGSTVVPYGYGGYGSYGGYGYLYPDAYPGYPYHRIVPGTHLRPRPDARAPRTDGGGSGWRPSRPDRGSGDRRPGGAAGGSGSGSVWELPGRGAGNTGPSGGGSGYVPNQPPDK